MLSLEIQEESSEKSETNQPLIDHLSGTSKTEETPISAPVSSDFLQNDKIDLINNTAMKPTKLPSKATKQDVLCFR